MTQQENGLTQPLYCLCGPVVHGKGNGRKVNMPTANLEIAPGQDLPPFGVYAVIAVVEGKQYVGVTNVGLRPTLDARTTPTVETYLPDFSGNVYGETLEIRLYAYLRPTEKMRSLRAVKAQVERDAQTARKMLKHLL